MTEARGRAQRIEGGGRTSARGRTRKGGLGSLGVLNILFTLIGLFMRTGAQAGLLSTVVSVLVAVLALVIIVLMWRKENNPFYKAR